MKNTVAKRKYQILWSLNQNDYVQVTEIELFDIRRFESQQEIANAFLRFIASQ